MTDEERARAAQILLDMPLFHALWDDMETAAINRCLNCKVEDHEARLAHAIEARAIRNFRTMLKITADQANGGGNKAPA